MSTIITVMRNMTEGNLYGHLLANTVPLVLGNMMQLTYNAADSIIVSKLAGEEALDAVSVSNPIMTFVVLGVSGLSIGASVLMSSYFGAGKQKELKQALSTTILFGLLFSIAVLILGLLFSDNILTMLNVPFEIMDLSLIYLRTVFFGFLFTFQYNIMTGALRSIGDARTPVYFLGLSCLINILLDLLFVGPLHMGVFGAALATVIAEGISALLCFVHVYRNVPLLQIRKNEMKMDHSMLKEILKSGSITALQQACQPIGKLCIQSVINAQGLSVISAFNAVCRVDDFACIPAQSIGHSIMTCTAQNRGAGKKDRMMDSFQKGLVIACCYYPIIFTAVQLLKKPIMELFAPDKEAEMISIGVSYLTLKAFFFIMPCITNAIQGFFRGMNHMKITLLCTFIQISIRTVVVIYLVPRIGINGEAIACLVGWIVMAVYEYGYYFIHRKELMYENSKTV